VRERTSYAFAVVSAAAALSLDSGVITQARIALGGVALKPWRAREAEEVLAGAKPGPEAFRQAADAALTDAAPSGHNAFKIDIAAAKAHPGVIEVMTTANRPALAQDPDAKTNPFMFRLDLLQNDRVRYANQPIAVVIAETLEAATEGAALLSPRYEAEAARTSLALEERFVPPAVGVGGPADLSKGDVEA